MEVTINSTLRSKVVQMHLAGYGRNKVARILQQEGSHLSEGSVGNIIRAYRQHEPSSKSNADINNTNSSIIYSRVGQTITPRPRDGNPLSHFLNISKQEYFIQISEKEYKQIDPVNPAQEEVDFSDTAVDPQIFINPEILDDPLDRPSIYSPNQSRRLEIPADNYNYYDITQNETIEETSEETHQSWIAASDTENSERDINLGIDFDSPEVFERRLMREIFNDKKERARHFQLMELEMQRLQEERQQLEQIKADIEKQNNDLKARQEKFKDVESLIPSLKEIQRWGVTFDVIFSYVLLCHYKSVELNVDLRTATHNVSQIIQGVRDVDTLNTAAEMARKQVEAIAPLTTLMNLQMRGFTDKDKEELVLLVQTWSQSGIAQLGTPGMSQGNGHGMSKKLDTKLLGVGN
jgi:hypothetical protein